MCGLAGGAASASLVEDALAALAHRGPDGHGVAERGPWTLGHVRLAIQDLTSGSAQPWTFPDGFTVTYAGEAWNTPSLRAGHEWGTEAGDLEPVARLLHECGADALASITGMFAFAWVTPAGDLWLARDSYGEIPLHWGRRARDGAVVYASEIGAVLALGAHPRSVRWVEPGTAVRFRPDALDDPDAVAWRPAQSEETASDDKDAAAVRLRGLLRQGVRDRLIGQSPIACLVSGGLDSSSVVALAMEAGLRPRCYTAVHDPRSTDLRHARELCQHFGLPLDEVPVPPPTAATLTDAVRVAEMPHKAQVEITLACTHLAAAIAGDGHRVVLSGEGSDELWASYGVGYHEVQRRGWFPHRWATYVGQHRKNFARTNKVFMRHGVEPRLPFLSPPLARYALTLDERTVRGSKPAVKAHEKSILALAMDGVLPSEVAWRRKAAFQKKAGLDAAAAAAVSDPRTFYVAEFGRLFGGVKP